MFSEAVSKLYDGRLFDVDHLAKLLQSMHLVNEQTPAGLVNDFWKILGQCDQTSDEKVMNTRTLLKAILCLHQDAPKPETLSHFSHLPEIREYSSSLDRPRAFTFDAMNRICISPNDQAWLADHFFNFYFTKANTRTDLQEYCLICYRPENDREQLIGCACERKVKRA